MPQLIILSIDELPLVAIELHGIIVKLTATALGGSIATIYNVKILIE